MEVKSVYMDLVEGKRKGNVWKLESEAFKKPIEIKICYDNQELALYKAIADAKTIIETLSWTILHLQEQVKLLEKKTTKQPMVFHDKQFISWRESCWLRVCDIPSGDYLMLLNTKVGEHNEYVNNEDGLIMEKIHVSGPYIPFYKLEWGTELDTPTATIYYDLVFIPI